MYRQVPKIACGASNRKLFRSIRSPFPKNRFLHMFQTGRYPVSGEHEIGERPVFPASFPEPFPETLSRGLGKFFSTDYEFLLLRERRIHHKINKVSEQRTTTQIAGANRRFDRIAVTRAEMPKAE